LAELRSQAEALAASWRGQVGTAVGSPDLFSEALSYALWRERKDLCLSVLRQPWCAQLRCRTDRRSTTPVSTGR
jgi:hypothetical protein